MITKRILLITLILNTFFIYTQNLNIPNSDYLNRKIKSVNVDENYRNGNWTPLLKQVKNKRIVLLGELNHGSKEIFVSRNDLIKSLYEKLGFNVILFESGIGELISIDLNKKKLTSKEMTEGFFDGWRTNEFVELMGYIKSNNMSISGFDVQRSGSSFENLLKNELIRLHLDPNQFSNIEKRFSDEKRKLTNRKTVLNSVQNSTEKLIKDYKIQLSIIEKIDSQNLNKTSHFVIITIKNRIKYLEYFLDFVGDKDWNKRWKARDYMMYSNIDWLLKTIYKNQKVIVIGHNFHISKHNKKEEVMGEFLKKEYDSEMYSIGIFAGKGSFANNSGKEENLKPVSNNALDIKHIINSLKHRISFLDIPRKRNKKSLWLFDKIIINDTFIDLSNSNEMVLAKSFDGLLFIDKISIPEKK